MTTELTIPELELPFDEDGNARLVVDGNLAVNVARQDAEGRLILSAPVAAELREDITYGEMLDLLDLALGPLFGGSPAIGRDPGTGMIIAYSTVSYAHLTAADWPELFSRFVEFVQGAAAKLMGE